ncbi:MAG: hypothetical protein L0G99_10665 [Propionibacteriales bacterium]|nr:hypothetical protein [Propionibacteriales bacterium]
MSQPDFEDVLRRLQGHVDRAADPATAQGKTDPAEFALPEVRGEGVGLNGKIRAVFERDKFTEFTIEARVMGRTNAELSQGILAAINGAIEDHTRKLAEAVKESGEQTEFASLQADLRDIQTQSLSAMKTYTDSMFDALGQMKRLDT